MNTPSRVSDFAPTASLTNLRQRAAVLRQVRTFFDTRDFLEVTTPLLSADTVVDEHLDPFRVTCFTDPRRPQTGETWYLQTSPEFHMKRLLAAGARSIYQVTQAFRAGEVGPRHNIEFTIVEWYRTGDDMRSGMQLLSELVDTVLSCGPARLLSYRQAFERHVGVNPHTCSDEALRDACRETLGDVSDLDRDDLLNALLSHQVAPQLGAEAPTTLFDYPASQAALAEVRAESPPVAERFELFFRGLELANGYHELRSEAEFVRRMAAVNDRRARAGKPQLPVKNRLLEAMRRGLPPCCGVALGFDRLVMCRLGEDDLQGVVPFPENRA